MSQNIAVWRVLLNDLCSPFTTFAAEFENIYWDHNRKPAVDDLAADVFMSRSTLYERLKDGDWQSVDDIGLLAKALTCTAAEQTRLINAFMCQTLNNLLIERHPDD